MLPRCCHLWHRQQNEPQEKFVERVMAAAYFDQFLKLTAHQRQEALQRLAAGETQADIARTYNVDATTIGRLEPRPFERASVADQPSAAA
jgi:hypothetical protein